MTQETGNQAEEVKLLPITEMEKMSHAELYRARSNAKTPEEQKHIAPYEHRAFAREFTEENPVTGAVGLAVAIPGYQAAKALGKGSRTGVDGKQLVEGYKGLAEGLAAPWKRVWNRVEESILEKPTTSVVKPWEKAWDRPEGKASPPAQAMSAPKTVKRSKKEDQMALDVMLTPAEEARQHAFEVSDSNLKELQTELGRTKEPSLRIILQGELDKLMAKRKK